MPSHNIWRAPHLFKHTRFNKALDKLGRELDAVPHPRTDYRSASLPTLIETFGSYNPIYGGVPKREVMRMLHMAAKPANIAHAMMYQKAGLAFTIPGIHGQRKMKWRLTAKGLMLLDHWAGKFQKFEPFVKAFVSKKARGEILSACVDFEMGETPKVITDAIEKSAKNMADPKVADRIEKYNSMKRRLSGRTHYIDDYNSYVTAVGQQTNNTFWHQPNVVSQTNLLGAQQASSNAYTNMLAKTATLK